LQNLPLASAFSNFHCGSGEEEDDAAFEAPKIYEAIESLDQLKTRLEINQGMYNEAIRGASMDLVFFKVAIDCVVSWETYGQFMFQI